MKIAYVVSGTTMYGGATKSIINLLKGFCAADGNKALVVCPDKEGLYQYILSGNISGATALALDYTYDILPFLYKPADYPLYLPRLLKRFIKNRLAASKLAKAAGKFGAEIIHSNTSVNNVGYLAAKKLNIPHIWHIREYGKPDFNMVVPFQRKKLLAPGNHIISITKDIAKYKNIDGLENVSVIYNGILNADSIRYSEKDAGYFLYAGKVTKNKGVINLINAYQIYAENIGFNQALPLQIAGGCDDEFLKILTKLLKDSGISDKVRLLGNRDDIADLMFHAKATIVPSPKEGFGRVLPEAMANGSLTIGRNTGGTKEQYDNGINLTGKEIGIRFNNIEDLALILKDVSSKDKRDYKEMILLSQKVISQLYLTENYSANIINLYKEILNNDKRNII